MDLVELGDRADHVSGAGLLLRSSSHSVLALRAFTRPRGRTGRAAGLRARVFLVPAADCARARRLAWAPQLAPRRTGRRGALVCVPAAPLSQSTETSARHCS